MKKYRKLPVEIEAAQWDGTAAGATPIIDWALSLGGTIRYASDGYGSMKVDTLEGTMRADAGDWIIRGVNGEFYPCKPDIFAKSYEEMEA